jgi:Mn-dependent DtxR family transcriptional regulator
MLPDKQVREVRDIRQRMGVNSNTASTYRSRLLASGLIQDAGRGRIRYTLPFIRDFLNMQEY